MHSYGSRGVQSTNRFSYKYSSVLKVTPSPPGGTCLHCFKHSISLRSWQLPTAIFGIHLEISCRQPSVVKTGSPKRARDDGQGEIPQKLIIHRDWIKLECLHATPSQLRFHLDILHLQASTDPWTNHLMYANECIIGGFLTELMSLQFDWFKVAFQFNVQINAGNQERDSKCGRECCLLNEMQMIGE